MAAGMNIDALIEIFDQIVRKFWKSDEYNSRECRYWSYPYLKNGPEQVRRIVLKTLQ